MDDVFRHIVITRLMEMLPVLQQSDYHCRHVGLAASICFICASSVAATYH